MDLNIETFSNTIVQTITPDDNVHYIDYEDSIKRLKIIASPESTFKTNGILGEGGMGVVYLAEQPILNREVAIKKIRFPSRAKTLALLEEARITGLLEHPGVVPIHQIIWKAETEEIEVVMKRVQGTTLADMLSKENLFKNPEPILKSLIKICEALEYAHSKGIIHRDIKNENIMIGEFGEAYLLDWGIALDMNRKSSHSTCLAGTLSNMAPEMLRGNLNKVNEQTDIYLLGASIHELLTNEYRHSGDTVDELISQIEKSEPYKYGEDVPSEIGKLINACCHKDMDKRPKSVSIIRKKLESFIQIRQAHELCKSALISLKDFQNLVNDGNLNHNKTIELHNKFHLARFGFEHALSIAPGMETAKQGLISAINGMFRYFIDKKQYQAAKLFKESTHLLDDVLLNQFDTIWQEKQKAENEKLRLQKIGERNDPNKSTKERIVLGLCVVLIMSLMSYLLSKNETPGPDSLQPDELFVQTIVLLIPIAIVLITMRKKLLYNQHGFRASVGIAGAVLAMFFHRWIGLKYGVQTEAIIFTDTFIVALAFSNTAPAIPSGMWISGFCISMGILTVLFPSTYFFASLAMIMFIAACVGRDVYREWKSKNTQCQ